MMRYQWRSAIFDNAMAVAGLLTTLTPDQLSDVKIITRRDDFVVFYREATNTSGYTSALPPVTTE